METIMTPTQNDKYFGTLFAIACMGWSAFFLAAFNLILTFAREPEPQPCRDSVEIVSRYNPKFACHPEAHPEFGAFETQGSHEALVVCRCPLLTDQLEVYDEKLPGN